MVRHDDCRSKALFGRQGGRRGARPRDLPYPAPRQRFRLDRAGRSDPEEMELLQRRYGLHPLAVEDALTPGQGAKAEAFGDQLFVLATTAALDGTEAIVYGQTAIFLARNFIITVRQGSARAHTLLRTQLEAQPGKLVEGPDVVLHGLLDYIVDAYAPLMDALDKAVEEMEEGAVTGFPDQARIRRIFRLRRRLRRFVSNVGHMEEVAGKLAVGKPPGDRRQGQALFQRHLRPCPPQPRTGAGAQRYARQHRRSREPAGSRTARAQSPASSRPGPRSSACRPRSPGSTG